MDALKSYQSVSSAVKTLFRDRSPAAPSTTPLMAWHQNFVKGWPSIRHLCDERFYRKWCYYLQVCAGAFRSGNFRLWQTVFGKNYEGVYPTVR